MRQPGQADSTLGTVLPARAYTSTLHGHGHTTAISRIIAHPEDAQDEPITNEHCRKLPSDAQQEMPVTGAFRHAWSSFSGALAAMVFLSLGLARLMGIALDSSPGAEVIQGMATELLFGGLALFAVFKYGAWADLAAQVARRDL